MTIISFSSRLDNLPGFYPWDYYPSLDVTIMNYQGWDIADKIYDAYTSNDVDNKFAEMVHDYIAVQQ